MMLSMELPQVCQAILGFPFGIHCIRLAGENTSRILLKLPVSYILPAKVNRGFKIYVIPVQLSEAATIGLMCAFFDDADSPLVSWRLLDESTETFDLLHALNGRDALVHFFDEQNRELLGYSAQIVVPLVSKVRLEHANFLHVTHDGAHAAHENAMRWFSLRNDTDDADAIHIRFVDSLFPEDFVIIDARPDLYQFHGDKGYGHTSLERSDPGPYQEVDIIQLLQRVFKPDQIYHGPKRHYDSEEIADVVVVTDSTCLLIQAKDSPNTEQTLNRTLKRKKLTSKNMLKDALTQLSGAVKYADRYRPLRMLVDGKEVVIDVGNRNVLSLAVVRELFLDMYGEYSNQLFDFFDDIQLPCIALDYAELHQYTTFCSDEETFLGAYFQVFDTARQFGSFPRLRFGLRDVEALWRRDD